MYKIEVWTAFIGKVILSHYTHRQKNLLMRRKWKFHILIKTQQTMTEIHPLNIIYVSALQPWTLILRDSPTHLQRDVIEQRLYYISM
jgi:hypothetical protein